MERPRRCEWSSAIVGADGRSHSGRVSPRWSVTRGSSALEAERCELDGQHGLHHCRQLLVGDARMVNLDECLGDRHAEIMARVASPVEMERRSSHGPLPLACSYERVTLTLTRNELVGLES